MGRRAFFLAGPVGALLVALGLRSKPKPRVPYWVEDAILKNYVDSVQRAAEKLAWVRR